MIPQKAFFKRSSVLWLVWAVNLALAMLLLNRTEDWRAKNRQANHLPPPKAQVSEAGKEPTNVNETPGQNPSIANESQDYIHIPAKLRPFIVRFLPPLEASDPRLAASWLNLLELSPEAERAINECLVFFNGERLGMFEASYFQEATFTLRDGIMYATVPATHAQEIEQAIVRLKNTIEKFVADPVLQEGLFAAFKRHGAVKSAVEPSFGPGEHKITLEDGAFCSVPLGGPTPLVRNWGSSGSKYGYFLQAWNRLHSAK